jgi:CBS domain-containing protein
MAKTKTSVTTNSKRTEPLRVQELMTGSPAACRTHDTANDAARIMWERDCGAVPVLDDNDCVTGMVTDRDICMAAYFRGEALSSIRLWSMMSTDVCTCRPEDDVSLAEQTMRARQVNRLPVVDGDGALVGMLALCDLTHAVANGSGRKAADGKELLDTVAAIRERRLAPAS